MSYFKSIWGDYFFSVLVLVIGLAVSLSAAWTYQKRANDLTELQFERVANDRIEMIRSELHHTEVLLHSLASFFLASDSVTNAEFRFFSKTVLEDTPFIRAAIWIPEVPARLRSEYERRAQEWAPGFVFRERTQSGEVITATQRDFYLPIYYTEPQNNPAYLGFDYATEPVRAATLKQARATRTLVATEKISLLQDAQDAIIFAYPLYRTIAERERFEGYILTVVPLAKLIDEALEPLTKQGVNILLYDRSANPGKQLLQARHTRLETFSEAQMLSEYEQPERMRLVTPVNVGGRTWEIAIQAAAGYFERRTQPATYAILAGGTGFSLLLFTFMFSRVRENQRVGQRVYDRTKELHQAKSKIETILFSTHDGVIGLDEDAIITFCNPMAAKLLGFSRQWDLRGQNFHALIASSDEVADSKDLTQSALNKVMTHGEAVTVSDEMLIRRDGTLLPVEYTVSPVIDENEISGAVVSFRDITERRRLQKDLERLASYDQLTGLANRMLFVDHVKKAIARASRTGKKLGIVYIDLNDFKPINDTMGHAAGDMLLKAFAQRLTEASRGYDLPARLGGDEFTILVDNLDDEQGCITLVERLLENLKTPAVINGREIILSGSIGIAFFPNDAEDFDTLISHADTAMYKSKKDSSNRYTLYRQAV